MAIAPGTRLGPYEVVAPVGAGGMGEVYRAKDTRLDRTVAIKVLPEHIADREDARSRFEREARSVASLNHPNICTLHDIGPNYMVMELVDGETLAQRLEKGPLPISQAIQLATQIADALDRAHRAGVTHRDVKPGNIMFARDGVKVLDFGLAKSVTAAAAAPGGVTLTRALTTEGTLVGTPQYMAPEQFEGREADARSDIWAFGAVVYEMVTGQRAFQGKNYTSMVAAILGAAPQPMSVKAFTPAWLERLVVRCLEKDPEDRWQSMRDIVLELRSPPAETAARVGLPRWTWPVMGGLFLGVLALAGVVLLRKPSAAEAPPMEFEIRVPSGALNTAVSPNGRMIAWRDDRNFGLWIRQVDSTAARMVEAGNPLSLSWSPDSKFLAYVSRAALRKLDAATLTSQVVAENVSTQNYGTAWTRDGHILMGSARGPLMKLRASGGIAAPALPLDEKAGELMQRFPQALPDGKHVLYRSGRTNLAASGIYLARLDGQGPPKRIYEAVPFQFVEPSTLLVYANDHLMALPLDARTGEVGEPHAIATPQLSFFGASADASVLALIAGRTLPEEISIYDRSGKKLGSVPDGSPAITAHLELSPDGRRLLLERVTRGNTDLWTVDLARKAVSRLTLSEGADGPGIWSPDGQKIYFRAVRPSVGEGIFEIPSNGAGTEKLIHKVLTHHLHVSPDGKFLLYERSDSAAGLDFLSLAENNKPGLYLNQSASSPQFSPDSRFVAYESSETGRMEIYIQTFPAGGGKWQVSTAGGVEPRWRGDGKELYYDIGDGRVVAAGIEWKNGAPEVVATRELFKFQRGRTSGTAIAVSADGKTFIIRESPQAPVESSILLKLNWRLPGR